MKCRICNSYSEVFDNALIINRYKIDYFQCTQCGFVQTEEPYWLAESYSSAITQSDIGLIGRNISLAERTRIFIVTCLNPKQSFVDYGGGYGIFTRIMRDKGFNFFHHDPLCQNIFALGFEAELDNDYSLLTAWEVFEHLANPLEEIEKMLRFSHTILFTTLLLSSPPKPLNEWWYYGLEHGQHISFYAKSTIETLCKIFNLSLLFSDGNLHLISDLKLNPVRLRVCMDKKLPFIRKLIKKPQPESLLNSDFLKITGKSIN